MGTTGIPITPDTMTASDIFNQERMRDRNQAFAVASIISKDAGYNAPPAYYLNIFNISPVEHVRQRPPDFPRIVIRACPKGDPWMLSVRVPNLIHYKIVSPDTGQPSFMSLRGERWATDILNPANLGENIWAEAGKTTLEDLHGGSDDLTRRGCFWTRNDKPTTEELKLCRNKLEKHYRHVVQLAEDLARTGKMNEIGGEAHIAADYLHVNSAWHLVTAVQEPCPNCGQPINPGIAYHPSAVGGVCVIDWKRSVAAGVKTKADVPEEMRWWTPELTPNITEGHAKK